MLKRQDELEARRSAFSPDRLKALEEAGDLLAAAEALLGCVKDGCKPLSEEESKAAIDAAPEGSLPLIPQLAPSFALLTLGAGRDMTTPVSQDAGPRRADWRRDILPGLLDRLHTSVTVYRDHIEIAGAVPVMADLARHRNVLHASQIARGPG